MTEQVLRITFFGFTHLNFIAAHFHYDIRFLFEADKDIPLIISEESNDLAWVEISNVAKFNDSESMTRMAYKVLSAEYRS